MQRQFLHAKQLLKLSPSKLFQQQKKNVHMKKVIKDHLKTLQAYEVVESTPQLFNHFDPHTKKDMVKSINFVGMTDRNPNKFPQPSEDFRKLTNEQYVATGKPKVAMKAMENAEIDVDLFKNVVETIGFREDIMASLKINMCASYSSDFYFDTALLGNYIEANQASKAPAVSFAPLNPNDMYTLVMLCPDYPFRLEPEGNFVHWMVTNIKGGDVAKGDTVLPYLQPLPSEYAGTFRYVFMLYKQSDKIDAQALKDAVEKDQLKEVQEHTLQEYVDTTPGKEKKFSAKATRHALEKENSKKAYVYELEYVQQAQTKKSQQFMNIIDFDQRKKEAVEILAKADYIPPAPSKPADANTLKEFNSRRVFSVDRLVAAQNLSKYPTALSFFRTEFDESVAAQYQTLGIQEPIYIPPDLQVAYTKKTLTSKNTARVTKTAWF